MMQMANPGFWLAALLLALGLFGTGYMEGGKHAATKCVADQARAQQSAQVVADKTNTHREAVAAKREKSSERIRVVYRTIKEQAHELKNDPPPDPPAIAAGETSGNDFDCGLDADGLRLWNAANSGDAALVFGKLDYRLPGATASPVGEATGPAGQPHRGDGAVRAMPGSADEAGGVREQ